MILRIRQNLIRSGAAGALLLACSTALAITPDELQKELARPNPPTVIDVRPVELFSQGHIHNAINIPASLCPQKTLPRLGRVIVYGDGFTGAEQKALDALNAKPGIQTELLAGGYSAWETEQRATTGNRGLSPEKVQYITYAQLKDTTSNVVLVDLRKQPAAKKKSAGDAAKGASEEAPAPLTDLATAFPGKPVTQSPHQLPAKANGKAAAAPGTPPLLVLIDNGDGSAQETARQLRAQGNTRVLILAGGEAIIARQGERGLQRAGSSPENFNNALSGATK
jgi:rhodanese-related sulfurtransferase